MGAAVFSMIIQTKQFHTSFYNFILTVHLTGLFYQKLFYEVLFLTKDVSQLYVSTFQ